MKPLRLIAFTLLGLSSLSHAGTIYKCKTESGQVLFTQEPCGSNSQKVNLPDDPVARKQREKAELRRKRLAESKELVRQEAIKSDERHAYISGRKQHFRSISRQDRALAGYLSLIKVWESTYAQAMTTPRISLSQMIGRLSELQNDLYFHPMQSCYEVSKDNLNKAQTLYLSGLTEFMADSDSASKKRSQDIAKAGTILYEKFWRELPEGCSTLSNVLK